MALILHVGDDVLCAHLGAGEFRVKGVKPTSREVVIIGTDGRPHTVFSRQCLMTPFMRVASVKRRMAENADQARHNRR
jgi:hypothetical protein